MLGSVCCNAIILFVFQAAVSMLKQEYKPEDNLDLKKSLALAIKVLSKTLDMTKVTPEKSE